MQQLNPPLRRLLALGLTLGALLALPAGAFASDETRATGGAAAETKTKKKAKKAKKPSVRQIQRALGIRADGVMGPKTRRAIKRFQRRNGLKADGIAGPATLAKLGLLTPREDATLAGMDPAAILAQIAECESGGDPTAVSPSGKYRGKYQFSQDTWEALGGTGKPDEADEATQDALALALYNERGLAPWPSCGAKLTASEG